jgi:hypothetical protein
VFVHAIRCSSSEHFFNKTSSKSFMSRVFFSFPFAMVLLTTRKLDAYHQARYGVERGRCIPFML